MISYRFAISDSVSVSGHITYGGKAVNMLGRKTMAVGMGIDMSFAIEPKGDAHGSGIIT